MRRLSCLVEHASLLDGLELGAVDLLEGLDHGLRLLVSPSNGNLDLARTVAGETSWERMLGRVVRIVM